jgi:hypothetical protein
MVSQLGRWAALAILCVAAVGCSCTFKSCGPDCGSGCSCGRSGSSFAGMKYNECCETCGPGFACKCGRDRCGGCRTCKPPHCPILGTLTDCAGCGERYWNEWYNDPPRCADPCDCCGNWVGPGIPSCCNHCGACGYGGGHIVEADTSNVPPLEVAEAPPAEDAETLAK